MSERRRTVKGTQTRESLKQAAANALERVPFHQLRVADVTKEAGVATGLYYHYFEDLTELICEVLEDFIVRFEDLDSIELGIHREDWYGRLYAHIRVVVEACAEQPGLMRCLVEVSNDSPQLADLWRKSFDRRLKLLLPHMPHLFPGADWSETDGLFMTYALGGIGDLFFKELFIQQLPELRARSASIDEISELISAIYYRALFLENPPPDRVSHWPQLLEMTRAPRGK